MQLSLFKSGAFRFGATCAVGENAVLGSHFDRICCAIVVGEVDAFRNLTFYCCSFAHFITFPAAAAFEKEDRKVLPDSGNIAASDLRMAESRRFYTQEGI